MFFELILVNYLEQQMQDSSYLLRSSRRKFALEMEESVEKVVEISNATLGASSEVAKSTLDLEQNSLVY